MDQMKKVMGAIANTKEPMQKSDKIMTLGHYSRTDKPEVAKSVKYAYESPNSGTHGLGGAE